MNELGARSTARFHRDVPVPMRDGTVLRADVWVPQTTGRVPVLLERLPYDKSVSVLTTVEAGLEPAGAIDAGYAVVVQDTRGRFASEGVFDPFASEAADGVDTIEWCARLPFCDGRVGMFGASYFGTTQLLAAAAGPGALGAIAPTVTGADFYEGWTYQGGAFQLGFALFWCLLILAPNIVERTPPAQRPAYAELLHQAVHNLDELYRRLPLSDLDGLEAILPFYLDWLVHDSHDSYWRQHSVTERYESIRTPALHVGGWYDLFAAGTIENYARLRGNAASAEAREGQRLVMGPWSHGNFTDTVGDLWFGFDAARASLDSTRMLLEFFDAHLRGRTAPAQPPVRFFLMGADAWREESDWPPPSARPETWFLHSAGRANSSRGDGTLSLAPCASGEPADSYVYDPTDPVPTVGGPTFLRGPAVSHNAGAKDQRTVEHRADVLVYTSAPLDRDLDVTGPVRVTLTVATSAVDTDFTAKLVDVHPDGKAYAICDGVVSLRHARRSAPAAGSGGGSVDGVRVELGPTAMRFRREHRIRLEISSSNFPRFARNPNSGVPATQARTSDLMVARQHVFHDECRPSALELTLRR